MNFIQDPLGVIARWFIDLLRSWGWADWLVQALTFAIGAVILAAGAMFFCLVLIWAERKIGGRIQDRLGPNRVGPFGIVQPVADMLKIFTKEFITPNGVDKIPYNLSPILAVGAVLMIWGVIPYTITMYGTNLSVGILYIVAVGGLGQLGIIMGGWGSNNKFSLLGAFRAVALLISYEIPLVVSLLVPVMLSGSMGVADIVTMQSDMWFIVLAPVPALLFFIASIAENGRAPFDLIEADSEIVAGFNTEYSGLKFGMFFVGDFLHTFTIAMLFATLFLGGWRGPWAESVPILGLVYLMLKTSVVYLFSLLVRFTLPRFRIDQMMDLNWKVLTPLALVMVMLTALVDKGVQQWAGDNLLVRIAALVVVNGVAFAVTIWLVNLLSKRHTPRVVSTRVRPLARPPQPVQPVQPVEPSEG
jgi:NADH-quinone oxidoreductase subunit H